MAVSDTILLKPGKLTREEFETMQAHSEVGQRILGNSSFDVLEMGAEIAASHHERWDGTGYPHGLAGREIPLSGRITAVADVFDALTHERPYKEAWPLDRAAAELRSGAGTHFDPRVVEAFLALDPAALAFPDPDDPVHGDAVRCDPDEELRALLGASDLAAA
jgi:putative two-component system response regulator